jgi:hypothetical protein
MALVADFVTQRLREWGVHRVYGYPGDGINALMGAFDRADGDPKFVQARSWRAVTPSSPARWVAAWPPPGRARCTC